MNPMERPVTYERSKAGVLPDPQRQRSAPKDPGGSAGFGIFGICTHRIAAVPAHGDGV